MDSLIKKKRSPVGSCSPCTNFVLSPLTGCFITEQRTDKAFNLFNILPVIIKYGLLTKREVKMAGGHGVRSR